MKRYTCLIIGLLVLNLSYSQEIERSQIGFVNKFIKAVTAHNRKAVIKLMDKQCRVEQLDNLDNNKTQFVDELFSGIDLTSDNHTNIKFLNILKIEIAEVQHANGNWIYTFRVRDSNHDIMCTLLLVKKKKRYSFIGAYG